MKKIIQNGLIALFLVFSVLVQAQTLEITGKVVDDSGEALPGTSIIVKGSTVGTSSDFDGNFSIQANETSILTFSFIGYKSQEVTVGTNPIINVRLVRDANTLDEAVVVAYGTQKKETITSSITIVKADDLKDVTTPSVTNMLQGKVAGVQVSASGGLPGSNPEILIRGASSLNGNISPLWVVDGVIQHGTPVINPNDVESMSILKDASATSLYGSRGSNGVIIVTTKTAKAGTNKLSFTSKVGINQFNKGNFEVMNSQQLYDYHVLMNNPNEWFTEDLKNRDYNWIEGSTQNALVQDYNLSHTFGTDKIKSYITGGYYSEEGTIKGNEFERYTFRLNLDYNVNKRLNLKPKMSFSFDKGYNARHSQYGMYTNLPWDQPYDSDGNIVKAQEDKNWIGRDQSNYLYDLQWNYGDYSTFNMSFNGDFDFKITDNLTYVSVNNFTIYNNNSFSYIDPLSVSGQSTTGKISNSTAKRVTRLTTQMLRYNQSFNNHDVNLIAGYEYNDYVYSGFSASGTGLISGGTILDVASSPQSISGNKNEYALQSLFLNANYTYNDKYFAKASIRRDGASNFGPNNEYATFYSLGAGWNISNEDFFNVEAIDNLKLRVSNGSVGNRPSSLYPYQSTYSVTTHYDANPAAVLIQYGNEDLTWEKSIETNIAIDARFFNRFDLTLEYYNKNTSDLLYFVDLPVITGFGGYWENVGGLKNTGVEFVFGVDIFRDTEFKWNFNFNLGVNKNEITELFNQQTEIPRGNKIFKVGEDMNSWYMRKWLGVNPDDGRPLWQVVNSDTGEVTETSNYNDATLQLVGTATPDFIGGFASNMEYKGFTLSATFSFMSGGELYNSSRILYDSDGLYPTFNQQVLAEGWSRWEKPGDIATHPQAIYGGNSNSNKDSSRYLEDRSYLRLRNVSFGYNLPQKLMNQIGLSNAKVYIAGDNLFTLTNYSGMDPEVGGISGNTNMSYPVPRRFVVGLNFSF